MSSFRIYNTTNGSNNIVDNSTIKTTIKNFNILEFTQLYKDEWCTMAWNPIHNQLSFILSKHTNEGCRGGINIINSDKNSTTEFQYDGQNSIEYFFSSVDGLEANIDPDYELKPTWNRLKLWLSPILVSQFPYYNIQIFSTSSAATIHIDNYNKV